MRLFTALALACAAFAQPPAFEVASVKPSEPITPALVQSGRVTIGVTIDARNVRISKLSLFDLTRLAHQVKAHQISGPAWIANERYDIQAKLPEGAPRSQVPAMMQTLLAERFGMVYHRETREFAVYALVIAKGGPHLKTPSAEDPTPPAPEGQLRGGVAVSPGGATNSIGTNGNSRVTPNAAGDLHIESTRMTLPAFADLLNRYCDRPVIDMTGLAGSYDMEFDVSAEELRNAAQVHGVSIRPPEGAPDPSPVSLPTSLQKLGLKLESRKAPAEVIVIDKVEKVPTEN